MRKIRLYTVGRCPECDVVQRLLQDMGLEYEVLDITQDPYRTEVVKETGRYSVPQLMLGKSHVGGFDEVMSLHRSGKLKEQLA